MVSDLNRRSDVVSVRNDIIYLLYQGREEKEEIKALLVRSGDWRRNSKGPASFRVGRFGKIDSAVHEIGWTVGKFPDALNFSFLFVDFSKIFVSWQNLVFSSSPSLPCQ